MMMHNKFFEIMILVRCCKLSW